MCIRDRAYSAAPVRPERVGPLRRRSCDDGDVAGGDDADDPTPEFRPGDFPAGSGGGGRMPGVPWDEDPTQRVRPGTLLIASTDLIEPTFARTVVYIIEHNEEGSLGVVLNRTRRPIPKWLYRWLG